ncbi:MAG: hypothetical protein K6G58_04420 [Lachnospiraceae bacterium]|nr:hypothetical protein [Lachnospiraceae bacterium]
MMNKDMAKRLKTAARFQRQAVLALLPEGMEGHLDVIEKEIRSMLAEALAHTVCEGFENAGSGGAGKETADAKVKKVSID